MTPATDHWIGFYRQRDAVYSIRIEGDRHSDRWFVGDGESPILPRQVS